MKRLLYAAVVFALIPVSQSFGAGEGPGCGAGTIIFKGQKGIVPQVLAATTNGSFGNQTFGMTTGTLGCTQDGVVKNEEKVYVFASANLDNLSQEMAQGQGEHLASLAALLGIPAEHQTDFFTLTQAKYTAIFPTEKTTSGEMLVALNQEMSTHPNLSTFVSSH